MTIAAFWVIYTCLLAMPWELAAQQDPPHSYSWYSGDIAGEVDRAKELSAPMSSEKITYLIDALRVNSGRWTYIETQVMENLDIDLDLDLVQEPLQNLALSELLLSELEFQQGTHLVEALRSLRRGCSVLTLLRPDETTPHPYSQKSLEARCSGLLDAYCPKQHPSMNGNEDTCRSIFEAILSNRQLRKSLLLENSKRTISLVVSDNDVFTDESGDSSNKINDALQKDKNDQPAPGVAGDPPILDRRKYGDMASTLYDSDKLMRLYTPEAPGSNRLALNDVSPNAGSLLALYLCMFISVSITGLVLNKRRQHLRRGNKPQNSLFSVKGMKEIPGQVAEALVNIATDVPILMKTLTTTAGALISDVTTEISIYFSPTKKPAVIIKNKDHNQPSKSKANKKSGTGGVSGICAGGGEKGIPSGAKASKSSTRGASPSVSSFSDASKKSNGLKKVREDICKDEPFVHVESKSMNEEEESNDELSAIVRTSSSEIHVSPLSVLQAAVATKDEVAVTDAFPEKTEDTPVLQTVDTEEAELFIQLDDDDDSSVSSLTCGGPMGSMDSLDRGDTPSPVIPFIADFQDQLLEDASHKNNNMSSVDSRPERNSAQPLKPPGLTKRVSEADELERWPRDFKLFSPTITRKSATAATFGHPTLKLTSPSVDKVNDDRSPHSTNSWMGIDGQVHTEETASLNDIPLFGDSRFEPNMQLYNYWGGSHAMSVSSNTDNSAVFSKNSPNYRQTGLKGMAADFSTTGRGVSVTDSSPSLSDRSAVLPVSSRLPISPPKKNKFERSSLVNLDVSFTDYQSAPSTGHSAISRTFSDDASQYSQHGTDSVILDPFDEYGRPLAAASPLPIAPALFGAMDKGRSDSSISRAALMRHTSKVNSHHPHRAVPPGFESASTNPGSNSYAKSPKYSRDGGSFGHSNPNSFNKSGFGSSGGVMEANRQHSLRSDAPSFNSRAVSPAISVDSIGAQHQNTIVLQVIGLSPTSKP